MNSKKSAKGKQKSRSGRHATNDPRRLTAEGWWHEKAKESGRTLRPKPGTYDI